MVDVMELRELHEKATKGTWHVRDNLFLVTDGASHDVAFCGHNAGEADAALIVAMHEALPQLLDALDEAARMQERVERLEAALKTCNEALKELQATVKGECPSLLDEDSGGSANLDMAIEDALEDSDVLLGRCRSCRCPRTWVPTDKCRTPLAHEEQETWADWAKAARTSLSTEMNSEGDK